MELITLKDLVALVGFVLHNQLQIVHNFGFSGKNWIYLIILESMEFRL